MEESRLTLRLSKNGSGNDPNELLCSQISREETFARSNYFGDDDVLYLGVGGVVVRTSRRGNGETELKAVVEDGSSFPSQRKTRQREEGLIG